MDTPIAASLLLSLLGVKYACEAARLLRSAELRAIEDKMIFFEKVSPFTKTDSRRAVFVVGLLTYFLAWLQYSSPSHPPFTGRWSWVYSFIYQHLGPGGMVLWWVAVGTFLLSSAASRPKP
jgi:hypothetical protein